MKQQFCPQPQLHLQFEYINKSQLNNSKAKQTFSFGKSRRFEQCKANCNVVSYCTNQLTNGKEGSKIGSSKRQPLILVNDFPAPGKYRVRTQVTNHNRNISFGMGRQNIKAYDYMDIQAKQFPSSTKYQVASNYNKIYKNAPVYSMRKRHPTQHYVQNTPGPAKYNLFTGKNRNLQLTKYKSVSFSTGKSKRFNNEETQLPGPGSYQVFDMKMQNYGGSNSRHHSSLANKFSHAKRKTYIDDQIQQRVSLPGPANYKAHSQFGQYDGNFYKNLQFQCKNYNDLHQPDSQRKVHLSSKESKLKNNINATVTSKQ